MSIDDANLIVRFAGLNPPGADESDDLGFGAQFCNLVEGLRNFFLPKAIAVVGACQKQLRKQDPSGFVLLGLLNDPLCSGQVTANISSADDLSQRNPLKRRLVPLFGKQRVIAHCEQSDPSRHPMY